MSAACFAIFILLVASATIVSPAPVKYSGEGTAGEIVLHRLAELIEGAKKQSLQGDSKNKKAAKSRDLQIFLQNILNQQINEDNVEQDLSGESVTVLQTPSKASEEDKGSFLKYIATNVQNLLQKTEEKFEIAKKLCGHFRCGK